MRHPYERITVASAATVALLLAAVPPALGQQRALDHENVLQWKTIDDPSLSPNGGWVAFVLTPMEGDSTLTLKASNGDDPALTVRGTDPAFTSDSRYLVYTVPPPEAQVEALKRQREEGDDLPQDALAVADVAAVFVGAEVRTAGIRDLGRVESYEVAPEGSWLAYVPAEEDGAEGSEESESETAAGEPAHATDATTSKPTRMAAAHDGFVPIRSITLIARLLASTDDGRSGFVPSA